MHYQESVTTSARQRDLGWIHRTLAERIQKSPLLAEGQQCALSRVDDNFSPAVLLNEEQIVIKNVYIFTVTESVLLL